LILNIFHGESLEVSNLIGVIEEHYGVEVRDKGSLDATASNAAHLLKKLGRSFGGHPCLWIVENELFYPEVGSIVGCAASRTALLSDAGLDGDFLASEALHEVGHVLGLPHCRGGCIMSPSASPWGPWRSLPGLSGPSKG